MSNLPAIPTAQEFATMKELGSMAINSGFLPASIKTPEQAVVLILKGRELGIPPMQAFSGINVIQGKPAVSPELMTALIYKNCPGAVINFIKTDNVECVIEAKRPGGKFCKFSFTMEDARIAGLLGKGNWKTYPAAMLRARALSAMARAMFADAIAGCSYTPEELGAETDDEGNVVSLPAEAAKPEEPRDVSPQSSPKEPAQSGTKPPQSAIRNPGAFEIKNAKREWNGKTIDQVVAVIGLAEFQKSAPWWWETSRNKDFVEIKDFKRHAEAYFDEVKLKAKAGDAPPQDWQDEPWPEAK